MDQKYLNIFVTLWFKLDSPKESQKEIKEMTDKNEMINKRKFNNSRQKKLMEAQIREENMKKLVWR